MAKINIAELPGYKEDMSAEDKLKLLEGYDIPEPDLTGYVKKDVLDAKAHEAAELSKKLKEKMTAEEQAKAEAEAQAAAMKERLETLERDKAISERTAYYLSRKGYDEGLAKEAAAAFVAGDTGKLNAAEIKAESNHEKAIRAELLRDTPGRDGSAGGSDGGSDGTMNPAEAFAKSIAQRAAETNKAAQSTIEYYTKTE